MRGLDRRIREQLTEKGYKVRSLVTHRVPWHRVHYAGCLQLCTV